MDKPYIFLFPIFVQLISFNDINFGTNNFFIKLNKFLNYKSYQTLFCYGRK